MPASAIQASFAGGEWSPYLNARVDLQKYHTGAQIMRNFFVNYRGGCSTRPGTRYILQCKALGARLIPFQASSTVQYVLEMGNNYIRFFNNAGPVLEAATTITGVSSANPGVITDVAHGYSTGDWIFITGIVGTTQLNGNYYIVVRTGANTYTLTDLLGNAISTLSYGLYVSGGTAQRVYTLASPFLVADLPTVKYVQSVNTMILCHPSYQAQVLTLVTATNWTINPITFGSTVGVPTGLTIATTSAGGFNVAYVVTALDVNNQESGPSVVKVITFTNTVGVTITLSWSAVAGAQSYNIYRVLYNAGNVPTSGNQFGFVTNQTGTTFYDTVNSLVFVQPSNFGQGPPIVQNPFMGGPVTAITVSAAGHYIPGTDPYPTVTIAAPSSGTQATASVNLVAAVTINSGGTNWVVNQVVSDPVTGLVVQITSVGGGGTVTGISQVNPGVISGNTGYSLTIGFTHGIGAALILNASWSVLSAPLGMGGSGYSSASPPAVTFSTGTSTATGTASVSSVNVGNPSVPAFYQQRLVLAAPTGAPQTAYFSQPGSFYNFNTSFPVEASDTITGSIVGGTLNTIKSMIPMPTGLIVFSDRQAWLLNGGTGGAAITPINATAQNQAYNGASDVPPIVANYDVLYVQAKGSIVRDLTYNFYTNIYTGTDISVLSSHLFYGFTITQWTYAEEPFKLVWGVRNDGELLSLTYLKEQELAGWARHDTNGLFQSVTSVTETVSIPGGLTTQLDAVYFIVQRTIQSTMVQYVERLAERYFNGQVKNAWCVDAALQYNGSPATVFSGLNHLIGQTVTGLADGSIIPNTVVSASGSVTLSTPASLVTIGLSFTPQLQTLRLDLGEPTQQGKRKRIAAVTVRLAETLNLSIGSSFSNQVLMKGNVIGNLNESMNSAVTDLISDDARTIIDPLWSVPGQYCFQQQFAMPASILGVIPEIIVGDTP